MRDGSEQLFQGNCTLIYGGLINVKYHISTNVLSTNVLKHGTQELQDRCIALKVVN